MDSLSAADKLMTALTMQETQKKLIANQAMNSALTSLQKKKYPEAISQFKRAIALDPELKDAYTYLGNTYLQQGNTKEAVRVFQQYLSNHPNSEDGVKNLANAYLQSKDYGNAEKQLKFLARLNPVDTYAPYTLGNLYVQINRGTDAEEQFRKVIQLSRGDGYGYYGLGLAYNKMGRYAEAVTQLQEAVNRKKDFAVAHYELGYALAKLGRKEEANEQLAILKKLDTNEANLLAAELRIPRMLTSFSMDFNFTLGALTPLNNLSGNLATPGATKDFSMVFQFDSDMDTSSVINLSNWDITKAGGGAAGTYNNGITFNPAAEITVSPMPKSVVYDSDSLQATVTFSITQNSSGTGVIDPSHLVFHFKGEDIYGKQIDPDADEFDGFAAKTF